MTQSSLTPVAIISGGGDAPRQAIQYCQEQQRPFMVLALEQHADRHLLDQLGGPYPHQWVGLGEIGKILSLLERHRIQELLIIGAVKRPSLRDLKLDWQGKLWLAQFGLKALAGDNEILSLIRRKLESLGYRVLHPQDFALAFAHKDSLTKSQMQLADGRTLNILTSAQPTPHELQDIQRGITVLTTLSPLDIGQATVIKERAVIGIEAAEGTQELIRRCSEYCGAGGIVVKMAKLQQDDRLDLPTIGLQTIHQMIAGQYRGLAIGHSQVIILELEQVIELAEQHQLFIASIA